MIFDALHPPHDAVPSDPAPATVLASWEPGTFLENLAPGPDGSWWVTSPSHRRVDHVAADGRLLTRVDLGAPATGIVADGDTALVTSGEPGTPGWRLLRVRDDGYVPVADLPGVTFANGMTRHGNGLVIADCLRGALVRFTSDGAVEDLVVDPLLTPLDPQGPLPGVNGLAVGPAGDLVMTSTGRGLVLRLGAAGLEVVAERLVGDDLTVTPDGALYVATHTFDSVLRLRPDGARADVATRVDGVVGPTSVALEPDGRALVVTTTGGMLAAPDTPEPARLVRIDLTSGGGHP
ncbi:SMP-30/gluconolactonase/LRE family protein [Actinomycetospora termitidis]|uniref:Uncharacterized protein n=1 Tax=Actinomycetospora termitidis TaxID=3053470 RepID=A0ABT7M6C8_9PSEU|nr:hypothetical protein [Actinomycetospora sp. Odt1-22]MDL5156214.1 hypothetical protein [Actinomycetospora sp. Odt1-22]